VSVPASSLQKHAQVRPQIYLRIRPKNVCNRPCIYLCSVFPYSKQPLVPSGRHRALLRGRKAISVHYLEKHYACTAEERVRSQASYCEICGGQNGTGKGFSPSNSGFPFFGSSVFLQRSIPIFKLILLLSEGQAGEICEPSNKAVLCRVLGSTQRTVLPHFHRPKDNKFTNRSNTDTTH
jgi:hypothetical protein